MQMAVFYRLKEHLRGWTVGLGIGLSGAGIALLIWDIPGVPTGNGLAFGGVLLGSGVTLILVELASVAQRANARELERELAALSFPAYRSAAQLADAILDYWSSGSNDDNLRARCLQLGAALDVVEITETTIASGSDPSARESAHTPASAIQVADQLLSPIEKALQLRPPAGADSAFRAGAAVGFYRELVRTTEEASSGVASERLADLTDRIVEFLRRTHQPDEEVVRVDATLRDVASRRARRETTELYLRLLRWHINELGNPAPVFSKLGWILSEGPRADDPAFDALASSALSTFQTLYPEGHS